MRRLLQLALAIAALILLSSALWVAKFKGLSMIGMRNHTEQVVHIDMQVGDQQSYSADLKPGQSSLRLIFLDTEGDVSATAACRGSRPVSDGAGYVSRVMTVYIQADMVSCANLDVRLSSYL